MKTFEIITLFPELYPGNLGVSIFAKSDKQYWNYKIHDLRNCGVGKNKRVDDDVFSDAAGMLIRPDVIDNVMQKINLTANYKKIFLSPRGKTLDQKKVEDLVNCGDILFLCGRYEGVDQRAIEYFDFEEISIGNYILSGGEVAAMVLMEAIIRKIPGVIGNVDSFKAETFVNNEISEPRYTRPATWKTHSGDEIKVDEIILSGDHQKIRDFQKKRRKSISK